MAATTIPGPTPSSGDVQQKNRRFWSDPFVEPKQQHRFAINFPVYMNMGGDDSTAAAIKYVESVGDVITTATKKVTSGRGGGTGGNVHIGRHVTGVEAIEAYSRDVATFGGIPEARHAGGLKVGPKSPNDFTSFIDPGLYLRISEYIGFSFTPPALTFVQGIDPESDAGENRPNDAYNKYQVGDATLSLVTTLRDDLNFSLNFLFAIATHGGAAGAKPAARLYPDVVYGGDVSDKVLVIKEYSAAPDSKLLSVKDTEHQLLNFGQARIVGIHKLTDPIIKSATFDPFTYGGTELIKVTLVLSYGTSTPSDTTANGATAAANQTAMKSFYSYQPRGGEGGSRYDRSYFTWRDDTDEDKELVPEFNKLRTDYMTNHPNWFSDDKTKAARNLRKTIQRRTGDPAPLEREKFIEDTIKSGNIRKINEMVTKTVTELLAEKEAAELDERARSHRRRREDQEAHAQRRREGDEIVAELERDQQRRDMERGNQLADEAIARADQIVEDRLERERIQPTLDRHNERARQAAANEEARDRRLLQERIRNLRNQ